MTFKYVFPKLLLFKQIIGFMIFKFINNSLLTIDNLWIKININKLHKYGAWKDKKIIHMKKYEFKRYYKEIHIQRRGKECSELELLNF